MNTKFQKIDRALRSFTNGNYGLFQSGASIDLFGNLKGLFGEEFVDNWMPENFRISELVEALREQDEYEAASRLETWAGLNL